VIQWFLVACFVIIQAQVDPQTPLQAYVNAPDTAYSWTEHSKIKGDGFDTYYVNLTTQYWLTPQDSDSYVWYHWLAICVPHGTLKPGPLVQAGIYADGGPHTGDPAPDIADQFAGILAVQTQQVVAHLYNIPNEPVHFYAEKPPHRRSEDAVIAYTWSHFLNNTNEPNWLLRLPMVKSVVKAMDCLQEFSTVHGLPKIDGFIIAGASKRGWTTWLTPVVDQRIKAIVPIVMPVLNMQAVINKLWQSLGEWSFALKDYLDMNLMAHLNDPNFKLMADIIDPYVYKGTMARIPKYLIIASGDEFFIPDAPREFWKTLPGSQNHLRVVPDSEHSMAGHALQVLEQVGTFVAMLNENNLPEPLDYDMVYSQTVASITVRPKRKPIAVTLFQASTLSSTMRDFRLLTCGDVSPKCFNPVWWLPSTVPMSPDGSYTASIRAPSSGWIGFMIEVTYANPNNPALWFEVTSEVNIVPDRYPFPPCTHGNGC